MTELKPIDRYIIRGTDGLPVEETYDYEIADRRLHERRERGERVFLESVPDYQPKRLS